MYSDDLGLREIGQSDWKVAGVASQSVLMSMYDRQVITRTEYYSAIVRLAQAGYYFLLVGPDEILWQLRHDEMRVTNDVAALLLGIQDMDDESALRVVVDVIRGLWLETALSHQRGLMLDALLAALIKGRGADNMLRGLKGRLFARLQLLPIHLAQILKSIDLWSKDLRPDSQG